MLHGPGAAARQHVEKVPGFDAVLERVRQALSGSGLRAVELHDCGEKF